MIQLSALTKQYGDFTAVDQLSLTIETGEFYGLLGPNGAGKTTTIGMLSTLLLPTSGEIRIDGELLSRQNTTLRRKISVVTQEYSMRQDMTVEEIMEYQGRLYYMPLKEIREKSGELLEFCGLEEFRKRRVRKLSGGMKRKLMVCRALLTGPQILLLDEPTAGMDAMARRQMWTLLRRLNERNLTILLTTHYMEEAEQLCSRVAMMNRGKLQRIDSPKGFIDELGAWAVDWESEKGTESQFFATREAAIQTLEATSGHVDLRRTTLEDAFLFYAGRRLQ